MSSSLSEISPFNSQPTELYKITRLNTVYYYTNRNKSIVFDGDTYVPVGTNRDSIKIVDSELDSKLNIKITSSCDLIKDAKYSYDNYPFSIQIWRIQNKDTSEPVSVWKSKISQVVFNSDTSQIICEGGVSEMYIPALSRVFAFGCRHILYDQSKFGCKVNKSIHEKTSTIAEIITQKTISFFITPAVADDYFVGGFIDFGNGIIRDIIAQDYTEATFYKYTITLIKPISKDILVGDSIKLYPGCNHNSDTCNSKFNNIENFGGYENIPINNPHTGVGILYYDGE